MQKPYGTKPKKTQWNSLSPDKVRHVIIRAPADAYIAPWPCLPHQLISTASFQLVLNAAWGVSTYHSKRTSGNRNLRKRRPTASSRAPGVMPINSWPWRNRFQVSRRECHAAKMLLATRQTWEETNRANWIWSTCTGSMLTFTEGTVRPVWGGSHAKWVCR